MAPNNSGANLDVTNIDVGPSAPPIIPIEAACSKEKLTQPN